MPFYTISKCMSSKMFGIDMRQSTSALSRFVFKCLGINFGEPKGFLYNIYTCFIILCIISYVYVSVDSSVRHFDDFDILVNSLFNAIGSSIGKSIFL